MSVRYDWDSNCDETTFKLHVDERMVEISKAAQEIQEYDGHGDFELLAAMRMALAELQRQQHRLMRNLSMSYSDSGIPELDNYEF